MVRRVLGELRQGYGSMRNSSLHPNHHPCRYHSPRLDDDYSPEALYLLAVTTAATGDPILNVTPEAVVQTGRTACAELRDGFSVGTVLVVLEGSVGPRDAGIVLGGAVSFLCPEYIDALADWLANQ